MRYMSAQISEIPKYAYKKQRLVDLEAFEAVNRDLDAVFGTSKNVILTKN